MTWIKEEWRLRDELRDTLDLCYVPYQAGKVGCVAVWHTATCHHPRDSDNWITGIPRYVAEQMWPTATDTSPVGYCQQTVIEPERD